MLSIDWPAIPYFAVILALLVWAMLPPKPRKTPPPVRPIDHAFAQSITQPSYPIYGHYAIGRLWAEAGLYDDDQADDVAAA